EHLDLATLVHADVRGLDVAMHDALDERGIERVGDLRADLDDVPDLPAPGLQVRREGVAFHKLHRDVRPMLGGLADLMNNAYVRMIERGNGLASVMKRWRRRGSLARSRGSSLRATCRSSFVSSARKTSPIPPAPSGFRIL